MRDSFFGKHARILPNTALALFGCLYRALSQALATQERPLSLAYLVRSITHSAAAISERRQGGSPEKKTDFFFDYSRVRWGFESRMDG